MNRERLIEHGKTLLIALLSISLLYLSGAHETVSLFFTAEQAVVETANTGDGKISQLAKPLSIVVTSVEHAHYGVKYSARDIEQTYSSFTAELGEALGTATAPVSVTRTIWENALQNSGVYFDYIYAEPISAVASWLGVEASEAVSLHSARRFCLAVEGDSVVLYYEREVDGSFYRCGTAVSGTNFQTLVEGYMPNGAGFAFEYDEYSKTIEPYYVILSEFNAVNNLTSINPLSGIDTQDLLEIFGMEKLLSTNYSESDGTKVYIEGDANIRISPEGILLYTNINDNISQASHLSSNEILSRISQVVTALPITTEYQLSAVSYDSTAHEYTVTFDYVSDGKIVAFAGRSSAMEFIISGSGILQSANIFCREYIEADNSHALPEHQALSLVDSMGGGEPLLCYTDYGDSISVAWTIINS